MAATETYLKCLEALVHATERVKAAAADQEWDRLLVCLEERQQIMNRIDAMPDTALSEAERGRAVVLLNQIAREDGLLENMLATTMAATRDTLGETARTQQSISAYKKATRSNPYGNAARFMDTQR